LEIFKMRDSAPTHRSLPRRSLIIWKRVSSPRVLNTFTILLFSKASLF